MNRVDEELMVLF